MSRFLGRADLVKYAPLALTLLVAVGVPSLTSAQVAFEPASTFGPFVQRAPLPVDGLALISGNTALVAARGVVHVFERDSLTDAWTDVAQLSSPGSEPGFAQRGVAIDGDTIVVGAEGVAYVFRRDAGRAGLWRETAMLAPAEADPEFGRGVDVDGSHAVVLTGGEPYIFKRELDGEAWQAVARLPSGGPYVGRTARISGDIVAVAYLSLGTRVQLFARDQGGPDNWGLVKNLRTFEFFSGMALDGEVLTVSIQDPGWFGSLIFVYRRHSGGTDAWGPEPLYRIPQRGMVCCLSLSGDLVADLAGRLVSSGSSAPRSLDAFRVSARNQGLLAPYSPAGGGQNAWGPVSTFVLPFPLEAASGPAISGDTVLLPIYGRYVEVLVSDIDGDGIRDGRDECVRDPLNNVEQGCRRAAWAHTAMDDRITVDEVTTAMERGEFLITATFTNHSDAGVKNPFFVVTQLTGGNLLMNADEGTAGDGATVSPDVGDGILSAGEAMTVTFRIRLGTHEPFQFLVTFHGDTVP